VPSTSGIRAFNDSDPNRYWSSANPWNSCKVAGAGVKIRVVSEKYRSTMTVEVTFAG
jgi:immune inhibitor A